jgi:hypothetical protein
MAAIAQEVREHKGRRGLYSDPDWLCSIDADRPRHGAEIRVEKGRPPPGSYSTLRFETGCAIYGSAMMC